MGHDGRAPQRLSRASACRAHLAIPFLGLALIDNTDPERLAKACAEEGRNEFLFTATPLRLVGATGAPAHPLAIF